MLLYAHTFSHKTLISAHTILSSSQYLKCSPQRFFNVSYRNEERNRKFFLASRRWNSVVLHDFSRNEVLKSSSLWKNQQRVGLSAFDERGSGIESESSEFMRKRKVVEHIFLLKAKGDLSDEEEKDVMDYLYTTQYQTSGIIALSLGRLSNRNPDGYTHAVYMRFQRREDLMKFYENSFYLGVLKDHVMPYCHGVLSVDFESEVEDDILPIFRKGEEFNYGVEFILLVSVVGSAQDERIEDALIAHANLASDSPSLIVQSTHGSNFNLSKSEYTHAAVIRFRSSEAFNMFVGSSEYRDMWTSKFEAVVKKTLAVHFSVDPVGTDIM